MFDVVVGGGLAPDLFLVFGGCAVINDFDVLAPAAPNCSIELFYDQNCATPMGLWSYVDGAFLAQATPNAAVPPTTARYALSGFAYNYMRDCVPSSRMARTEHLRDILIWFENQIPEPVGVDPIAFANKLEPNYPNPFNPTTTIKYSIAARGHVSLKVYNAAGQLVRTLVDDVQAPQQEGFSKVWNGMNDQGQPVSSGVYFYKLVSKNFSQTKKMVLLK
jgi:hypothetical protein